jgi:hypothetical protein
MFQVLPTLKPKDLKLLLKKFQLRAESNIFLLKRNTLNTNKFKKFTRFLMRSKLSNMKKSLETKESPLRRPLLITMPLRLKLNTLEEKLRKLLWLKNLLKESTKESNIFQSKLKLFTILKEITTSQPRLKLEPNMLEFKEPKEELFNHQLSNKPLKLKDIKHMPDKVDQESVEHTFQVEVVLELLLHPILLAQSTPPNNTQLPIPLLTKPDT